jgi:lysophospholipase L1-like esterase
VTRKIEVIDHLIVNIGDSYAAGEGVPEKNFWPEKMGKREGGKLETLDPLKHFVQQRPFLDQWADPGTLIPRSLPIIQQKTQETDNRLYAYSGMDKVEREADGKKIAFYRSNWDQRTHRSDLTGWEPDWPTISAAHKSTYRMLMTHQAAHRSSAAAASQLALHLESRDDKSSVTFLNLAASGATIDKGLLGRYNGVEDIKSPSNPTTFRPRDRRGNIGLEPQVDELKYLLGQRSADSVYLSVGGNDVGFANIIAVFLTAFDGDSKHMDSNIPPMFKAFKNGTWSSTNFGGFAELGGAYASFDDTIGLDKLRDGYERLNAALSELNISGDINLIGYPNFSSSTRDDTHDGTDTPYVKSSAHGTNYCNLRVKRSSDPHLDVELDFDPIEFKVADEEVLTPLYNEMVGAVDHINQKRGPLRWNFIDQGLAPSQHGICGWGAYKNTQYMKIYGDGAYSFKHTNNGDMTKPADILTGDTADADNYKWYRTPQDGAAKQLGFTTTNKGMFHPNEFGYRHTARMMMSALKPYGAELDMPTRLASMHHDAKDKDRFSDPDDSIREATDTVGLRAGCLTSAPMRQI